MARFTKIKFKVISINVKDRTVTVEMIAVLSNGVQKKLGERTVPENSVYSIEFNDQVGA